jgi:RimJ/RimL family protein N-acetyltransferase
MDLSNWNGVQRPQRVVLDGRYGRLEPLDTERHENELLESAREPGSDNRFRYLFEDAPGDAVVFRSWIEKAAKSDDPLFFAVINKKTGRAEGRQALMRIDPVHGVIEVGNILWGPAIARTRVATEALYLFAEYVFDTLGYRRFEWKCNDLNEPSKLAAERFGFTFEGIFRQHMVAKGENRNTAWFAMTDGDWSLAKKSYQAWLAPENFGDDGQQKASLKIRTLL